MKAIFVLYPNDPKEYFEIMHQTQDMVFERGGHCSVACKIFSGWEKAPREYLEYIFECERMEDLLIPIQSKYIIGAIKG